MFVGNGVYQVEVCAGGTRPSLSAGVLSVFVAPCGRFEALALPFRALAGRLIETQRRVLHHVQPRD